MEELTNRIVVTGFYERRVRILTRLEGDAREIRKHVAGVNFGAHGDNFHSDAGSCTIIGERVSLRR